MPARDQNGPQGEGPMSGKGMGNCTSYSDAWTSGHRIGFGRGRGFRNRFFARPYPGRMNMYPTATGPMQPPNPEEEEQVLKGQASWLQNQLDLINNRIATLREDQSDED